MIPEAKPLTPNTVAVPKSAPWFWWLVALQVTLGPSLSAAPAGSKWVMGDPLVWYFAGPGYFNLVNDLTVSQLVAGGWNLGWAYSREELDTYHRHGMRALAAMENPNMDDPAQVRLLAEKLAWSDHPATYGYWISDEPAPEKFQNIGKVVAYLRQHNPTRPAVVNLLPVVGTADGDVITPYRANLQKFITEVKPDVLCYDFYPFMAAGDGVYYFLNLMLIREAALKAGIPFINITQAIAHENLGYRWPTEAEMRWLSYTTLAYGGQVICWYLYNDRLDVPHLSGFFEDPPDSKIPKKNYWSVSRINRDFLAIARELQPLKSLGAYHAGPHAQLGNLEDERWKFLKNDPKKDGNPYWARHVEPHLPYGGVALPANFPFKVASPSGNSDLLLGCFGNSGKQPSHVLLVNLNYQKSATATLQGPGPMEVYHSPTHRWTPSPDGAMAKLELPPGGGVLLRLRKK
jgi:hypothetical protein